ncbi:MAG: hypothetical protein HWN81_02535 [Candidatus Lokiarchaeota archaeon]|nr:hypothetical protein [Candidatus Lokiarchaeota archaeon]
MEFESKLERESEHTPDQEFEKDWEFINYDIREPVFSTPDPELKSNEYQKPEEISESNSEQATEQNYDLTPESEPEQKPIRTQEKNLIKVKELEPITDPKELRDYKHYEYEHAIKNKNDYKHEQEPSKETEESKKTVKKQKKKPKELK